MTRTSLRLTAAAVMVALVAGAAADAVSADLLPLPPPPAINLFACALGIPQPPIAPGSTPTLFMRWVAANRGLEQDMISASNVAVSINDVPLPNTNQRGSWTVQPLGDGSGDWYGQWTDLLGPATQTFQLNVDWTFTHPVIDRVIFNPSGSPLQYRGSQLHGSCTITVS